VMKKADNLKGRIALFGILWLSKDARLDVE
jgi:hypothetical protein